MDDIDQLLEEIQVDAYGEDDVAIFPR